MSEADSTSRRRPPTIDLTAKEVETAAADTGAAKASADVADLGAAPEQAGKPDPAPEPAADAGAASVGGSAAAAGASAAPGPATNSQQDAPAGQVRNSSGRALPYVVGIVAGAVGAAAVAAAIWFAGLVPAGTTVTAPAAAPERAASLPAPQAPQASVSPEISSRLERIEQALQGPPRTDAALASQVAAAEAQSKALAGSFAALTRRVDDVAAAAQTALADAKGATVAADAAKNAAQSTTQASVQRSDIDTLEGRVAALQSAIKTLDADLTKRASSSNADDRTTRLAIAAEALRAVVERGAPFTAELAAAKALGADPEATARLEPLAAQGLTGAAELGRELAALMPALQGALAPERNDNSILAKIESQAQKLVRITPVGTSGAPVGDDPAALIARLNADAARGDIDAALADIAKLPDPARALAQAWSNKAAARQAALADSRHIAAAALASLAKPEPQ
jgi:hypothetical protein